MLTATRQLRQVFPTREAALAPLRERQRWGDLSRGMVSAPESRLTYTAGAGRARIVYPLFVYADQTAEGRG